MDIIKRLLFLITTPLFVLLYIIMMVMMVIIWTVRMIIIAPISFILTGDCANFLIPVYPPLDRKMDELYKIWMSLRV